MRDEHIHHYPYVFNQLNLVDRLFSCPSLQGGTTGSCNFKPEINVG